MRTPKIRLLVLTIGFVAVGGLARSDRQVANVTTVIGRQRQLIDVDNNQDSKSQGMRFTETDGLEFERTVVKGLPFSAVVITELIQTNSNNAADVQRSVSLIYRDWQGRTRRDRMSSDTTHTENLDQELPLLTTINDPVSGYSYVLENRANVARRSAFTGQSDERSNIPISVNQRSLSSRNSAEILAVPASSDNPLKLSGDNNAPSVEAIREPLGQRETEGFMAEGTRISMNISPPARETEKPQVTTIERWYSPDLKAVLLIERFDPRFGKIVSRVSRIQRNEPTSELFTVPSGFKTIPK
jgi:hypothetical protein